MRAWFSTWTKPSAVISFLMQVVLLVVERGAAQVGDAERSAQRPVLLVPVLPGLRRGWRSRGRRSCPSPRRAGAPPTPWRWAAVLDAVLAQRAGDAGSAAGALGAEPPTRDRAVGVALDLGDPAALT